MVRFTNLATIKKLQSTCQQLLMSYFADLHQSSSKASMKEMLLLFYGHGLIVGAIATVKILKLTTGKPVISSVTS